MYISKERYCHSAVVAIISMHGERVRYFIETELCSKDFKCMETVRNVIDTVLW